MNIIKKYDEIVNVKGIHFVLLYKSGIPESECALENVKKMAEKTGVKLFIADVNKTRDVHPHLRVTSTPTLVVRESQLVKMLIKGCQNESYYKTVFEGKEFASFQSTGGGENKPVIVYTTPTCSFCHSLKSYLNEKQVHFREVDVSIDHQAGREMVQRSGQQGVPQTLINGQIVVGFDRAKINQLLNIN